MAAALPEGRRAALFAKPYYAAHASGKGPIGTLAECERFDEMHFLSNYDRAQSEAFVAWIGSQAHLHGVAIKNPTDYREIFDVTDGFLREVTESAGPGNVDLCIHLSSGTPTMAAIWVLLGKSRYPATFFQTYKNEAFLTEIPFDLEFDYVPELLRNPDVHLQHLAARPPSEVRGFEQIVGDSRAIREAVGRAARAALRNVPVLLVGESGTGKEMFARAIHGGSARRQGPFVALNCAAIPQALLESELFGHCRGAFTGAAADRPGAFEQADRGTLFLDEIGECEPDLQAKLLRVLQPPPGGGPSERSFRRVGEGKERTSDVRVIAATNKNLLEAIRRGSFREDLYYRLAVVTVNIPPLSKRRTDIPLLARRFLDRINEQFAQEEPGYVPRKLAGSAMSFLTQRSWLGNVRELYNVILQAAVMSAGEVLSPDDLRAAGADFALAGRAGTDEPALGEGFDLEAHLRAVQARYLTRAMEDADGVKTRAARLLGYRNYQTLDAQLKRLGVRWRKRRG